ncbi:long-chain-fatty-acid--CoA ligase ACSBG2 [Marmota monax]|uniref:long-chain-fatty-acid--CoA ligase ACSBG2 n=1 Tax=Marmota monax TaxID=9995 RepID=UPI001EB03194|nr:long-chain-fatty-acid--CoA ligase ACSBG2 [Marmota monax]
MAQAAHPKDLHEASPLLKAPAAAFLGQLPPTPEGSLPWPPRDQAPSAALPSLRPAISARHWGPRTHLGPPAGQNYWTSERHGQVQLRLEKNSLDYEAPLTVHDMVMDTAIKYADYIALGSKHRNGWHTLTYIEYYEQCRRAAKAFLKLGLERFHSVGIMGFNSAEWAIASIGAIMAGGFSVGILSTTSPKACQVIAENTDMDIFVVDNDRQLQKVTQIQSYLKHLKGIVQYKDELQVEQENLYSWKEFLNLAGDISDEKLDRVIDSQKPNQCCTLVYSMGSTSLSKIVMLSHDNITWTTAATVQSLCYKCPPEGQEVLVSYLPLSYIKAQIFDMWVAILVAGTLYFAPPEAGRVGMIPRPPGAGFLMDMLQEVQPTTFYGTPWIWERMLDNLKTSQLDSSTFRRKLDCWAMKLGLNTNKKRMFEQVHPPLCFRLAKMLTFNRARKFLGLSHCEQFFNIGLGLPTATLDFFLSLNIPIFEVYGLSEGTGIHTLSSHQAFRLPSCGKGLPNTHTKVKKENEKCIGNICIWGRNIFMGYLNDKEGTQKMMDCYGWMNTRDLGCLDVNGFLYVLGNVKDLITLSSGEKINPRPIEERVKMQIPIVRHVMVVGQDAPYLCALLTLKCQINSETGEPRTALTSEAVAFCRKLKSQSTRLTDILHKRDPVVMEFISQGIKAVNAGAPSESARIIKWAILDTDFSVGGGELGITERLKRVAVAKMYQAEINDFYEDFG